MGNKSPKTRAPELEHAFQRNPDLGYEPEGSFGYIRCLEHGAPNPLIRWHYHEEYELHLITETSGKVFVGDYIGRFKPGNLVLTGPRLPHNWISTEIAEEGVEIRDRVLQFPDEPLRQASELIPELREAFPLLERAKHGIEFNGMSDIANESMGRILQSSGLERFSIFLRLLSKLSQHQDYRLLSSVQLQSFDDDASLHQISEVVDYMTANYATPFTMSEIAERIGMTESRFSRYFRRATGNTFTDFVNHLRINRACQLLMETEQYISTICYNVGFNNVANFNRRFMEIKGMTPSEFRKQGEERFGR
ncbi:helix-turn-helix domain-containing protein [Leucothrix pacifica]|uniref:AraC family transcriptional regulator n=1 Tax=Leucothrix pacifica TaxID=1247513 RepID=A0A317CDG5_9GAMM|nr:AraC family transcriptional regulator [Leucothrix pacifica]PWQ96725.1 AraC family transcriptional regulator [Leucothrix pacifica]